jgi:hypothetical protein
MLTRNKGRTHVPHGEEQTIGSVKLTHIDVGFYRISDKDAVKLAKATLLGRLPRPGYEVLIELADGRRAWLIRTPHRGYTDSPARGWVWALYGFHSGGQHG